MVKFIPAYASNVDDLDCYLRRRPHIHQWNIHSRIVTEEPMKSDNPVGASEECFFEVNDLEAECHWQLRIDVNGY